MLRLMTTAIFSIYISAALATPNLNFATAVIAAENVPFHFNYSPVDLNYGKDIDLLFSELGKNQLTKKTVNSLSKYQNAKHSFTILNPIYDRLKLVLAIDDQNSFYKNCEIVSKNANTYTDSISDRLNISIDKHCRYLFLNRMGALSPNINFSSRDLAYFKDATSFFASGENRPELVSFLRHFKTNPVEHEKISNFLIEKYIDLKIRPATNIMTNLKVSIQFNKFLQNNLNLDDTSNSYFQDEFQRLARDAQEAAEKGEANQAKLTIISAVNFYNRNKNFINQKKAWSGVIRTAKALFYKGKDNDSIEIFGLAKTIAAKDDFSETNFYLTWPYIINRDFKGLRATIDKHGMEKSLDKFDSKLQFWIATALIKTGDLAKGTSYLNKIIESSPFSFYSILSLKEIASLNKGKTNEEEILSKLVSKNDPADFPMDKAGNDLKDALRRYAVWNKIGNERFATLELRYLQSLPKELTFKDADFAKTVSPQAHKEFLILNTIRFLNSQKKFINSFRVFQDSLEQNSLSLNYKLIKFIFPLNYMDIIKKNSENIDPLIVISLIRQESAFNPEAKSGVGAKGLMQLMPATAKRFNRRVRISHLGNPEINIAIGTKYFRLLLQRFDGNLIYALASYNAGENRIDRWRKDIFRNDDPLSTIEAIPFEETRNYVKFIYRNNFFYSLLQNRSVLMTPLEESFRASSNGNIKTQ